MPHHKLCFCGTGIKEICNCNILSFVKEYLQNAPDDLLKEFGLERIKNAN